jgi:hypothetical protein
VLRGCVAGERRQRQASHDRAGRDDHTAARAQRGQCRADDVDSAGERDRNRAVEVVGVDLEEVPERDRDRVGDEDVEATEACYSPLDGGRGRGAIGDVGRERVRHRAALARHGGGLVKCCFPARDQREVGALVREALDGRKPHAAAGSGDEDPLAGKTRHVFGFPWSALAFGLGACGRRRGVWPRPGR